MKIAKLIDTYLPGMRDYRCKFSTAIIIPTVHSF